MTIVEQITTSLNQQTIVEPTVQFGYKSVFPLSDARDVTTETNGGTVTVQNGAEYRVRATTTAGSIAQLQTKQFGDYIPGHVFMPSIGMRVPTQPTGDAKIEWGYYDGTDGAYVRYDSSGLTFIVESGGVEKFSDTLDSIDPSDGMIWRFPFMFYGYGWAGVDIGDRDASGRHSMLRQSTYYPSGESLFENSNLPLRIRVEGDGTQLDAFVGGRNISTLGKNERVFRTVSEIRKGQASIGSSDYVPMVSVKIKDAFKQIYTEMGNLSVIADDDMELAVFRNTSLTGSSFGTPADYTASEVATEWDNSATAISGGTQIYGDIVQGGTGAKATFTSIDLPDQPIVSGDTWSFCLRLLTGTGGTATLNAMVRENW